MLNKEDVSALSKTELLSRIQAAKNLIIGLWVIGALNLLIVAGLLIWQSEGADLTMGVIVGVVSMAAAAHLTRRRSEFRVELEHREVDPVVSEST